MEYLRIIYGYHLDGWGVKVRHPWMLQGCPGLPSEVGSQASMDDIWMSGVVKESADTLTCRVRRLLSYL